MTQLWNSIIAAIIGVISSSGIIIGLGKYFGSLIGKTYIEKIKSEFSKDLKAFETKLEIYKDKKILYSSSQFKEYNQLWITLYDLKRYADVLWINVTSNNLGKFSKQLRLAEKAIQHSALLLDENHYLRTLKAIQFFKEYEIGKKSIMSYREDNPECTIGFDANDLSGLLEKNKDVKDDLEKLIEEIRIDLKDKLQRD